MRKIPLRIDTKSPTNKSILRSPSKQIPRVSSTSIEGGWLSCTAGRNVLGWASLQVVYLIKKLKI